jgi:hypothetical protein
MFLSVTGMQMGTQGKMVVNRTMTDVEYDYAERLYHSCENVQVSATGQTAMHMVFHSDTPMQFLQYLGEKADSPRSPLQIDFQWRPAPKSMHNIGDLHLCNTTDYLFECSCVDW